MKFKELDDKAKERARDWWRGTDSGEWWESIYDDACTIGALMGIEISALNPGTSQAKPDIWFSGFSSQGDGLCYSGFLETNKLTSAVERMAAHVGGDSDDDKELLRLAGEAEEIHRIITTAIVEARLADEVTDLRDDTALAIQGNERSYSTRIDPNIALETSLEMRMNMFVSDFATWIYHQLEAEDEYLNENDYIDDRLTEGEYEFDEDGKPD